MPNDHKIHKIFLNIAKQIASLSNCVSYKVGAIIVKNGRILSTGYNGTPSGCRNCNQIFDQETFDRETHHKFSQNYQIHAQINAILFAAKDGISIDGSDIYVTVHPCNKCLKAICNSGIKRIFYEGQYDKFEDDALIQDMLDNSGVVIQKI